MTELRFPGISDRTLIIGETGTGKSQFGLGVCLAYANFHQMPWVIFNYKHAPNDLLSKIQADNHLKEITPYQRPPKRPGLYVMRAFPKLDDAATERWLYMAWAQQNIGLFVDEAYMLPDKDMQTVLLTQGRALNIPMYMLYQRATWLNRFNTANATFVALFAQDDIRDRETASKFVSRPAVTPAGRFITARDELPHFHCLWADKEKRKTHILSPAPSENEIRQLYRERLGSSNQMVATR